MNFFKKFNKLKNDYKDNNTTVVSLLVGLFGVLALTFGTSYAYLSYSAYAEEENSISAGTLVLDFGNESDALYMMNAVPQLDEEALKNNSEYSFTVNNNGTLNAKYEVRLVNICNELTGSYTSGDVTVDPDVCIPLEYIKVGVKQGDSEYTVASLTNEGKFYIGNGTLDANSSSIEYKIKIWLDKNTPDAYQSELNGVSRVVTFIGELEIYGEQIATENYDRLNSLVYKIKEQGLVTEGDGLYVSTETNDGRPTYYYHGAVENNYVSFAGLTWRVVRINEDGTIKMIIKDPIGGGYFNQNNYLDFKYMYYSESNVDGGAMKQVNEWYSSTLAPSYDSYIATSNFCESAKVKPGDWFDDGNANMETINNYVANFRCPLDGYGKQYVNTKAGLITVDEVVLAGVPFDTGSQTNNTNTYLYYNWAFFTMSPAGFFNNSNSTNAWLSLSNGSVTYYEVKGAHAIRPVINLKANTIVTGTGASDDMWVVQTN